MNCTWTFKEVSTWHFKDKDKDSFIGRQEFVVGYSKAPEQPQSSARPICHSHAMTSTRREPATIRTAPRETTTLLTVQAYWIIIRYRDGCQLTVNQFEENQIMTSSLVIHRLGVHVSCSYISKQKGCDGVNCDLHDEPLISWNMTYLQQLPAQWKSTLLINS